MTLKKQQGFLPLSDPLRCLPKAFKAWEEAAAALPKWLMSAQSRVYLEQLPKAPWETLAEGAELERAMVALSFLGHAYLWGSAPVIDRLPAVLAQPWVSVASRLGRPAVLSYASYALHNWFRLDVSKELALGNIALLQNFLGGMDEEWFVLVHIDIEAKAAPALQGLPSMQAAILKNEASLVLQGLEQCALGLQAICETLDRMPERCDPYIYYNRVRPYIHGWKNNPALPQGLIYEGCYDHKPQCYRGETGAQSTIIPSFDAVLGITHQADELSVYLKEMRQYMPVPHRAFLEALEAGPSVRTYLSEHPQSNPLYRELYNHCIDLMVRFRVTHLKYAAQYIQKQSQHENANSNAVGTGGTPFMAYLSKHEKESERFKL